VSAVRPIAFNGKFRAGKHNGVSRVADRLIREVDSLLSQMPPEERPPVRLIVPSGCPPEEPYRAITIEEDGQGPSQKWEQRRLPRLARGACWSISPIWPPSPTGPRCSCCTTRNSAVPIAPIRCASASAIGCWPR
jgi:hypothetical protein